MVEPYREDDGMDPGLGDLAYDGTEYEVDEFGERIGSEDSYDDSLIDDEDDMSMEDSAATEAEPTENDKRLENGFGETLNHENNPHLEDQLDDSKLNKEAESDYAENDPTREEPPSDL